MFTDSMAQNPDRAQPELLVLLPRGLGLYLRRCLASQQDNFWTGLSWECWPETIHVLLRGLASGYSNSLGIAQYSSTRGGSGMAFYGPPSEGT